MSDELKETPLESIIKDVVNEMQRLKIINCAMRIDHIGTAIKALQNMRSQYHDGSAPLQNNYLLNCYYAAMMAGARISQQASKLFVNNDRAVHCSILAIGEEDDKHCLVWVEQRQNNKRQLSFLVDPWISAFIQIPACINITESSVLPIAENFYDDTHIKRLDKQFTSALTRLEKQKEVGGTFLLEREMEIKIKGFFLKLCQVKIDFINNIKSPKVKDIKKINRDEVIEVAGMLTLYFQQRNRHAAMKNIFFAAIVVIIGAYISLNTDFFLEEKRDDFRPPSL